MATEAYQTTALACNANAREQVASIRGVFASGGHTHSFVVKTLEAISQSYRRVRIGNMSYLET